MSAPDTLPSIDRRSLLRGSVTVAGVAVALPGLASLAGCTGTPPALTNSMDLIAAVSDRIIPETASPGALGAKVPDYIAAVFDQHFTPDQQRAFADGIATFDSLAEQSGAPSFASASAAQQDAVLSDLDTASDNSPAKAAFSQIRDMVIFGYYTSEVATEELAYEEYPGRYDGCVPLADIGSAWLERGV